jgi:hypothetical protein
MDSQDIPDNIQTHYFFDFYTGLKIKQYNDLLFSPVLFFDDYREVGNGIYIERGMIVR